METVDIGKISFNNWDIDLVFSHLWWNEVG